MNSPLQTDLYELTMAAAYWHAGLAERRSCFQLSFRSLPFGGGYAVAAGLEDAMTWLENFSFQSAELDYLANLRTERGTPLFAEDFLSYLAQLRLQLNVAAMAEGTVVFAHEPLLRIEGPVLQAQLVETALLNLINFQTLIATKAARIAEACGETSFVEFGYRRAQGPDGALSASRAAWIGGAAGTSNVLAGQRFGIPVKGTHAHSWVMAFADEREAFARYAEAMPDNSVLLVDTYDSLDGVRHAIETGRELRRSGHELNGIRLDSGDLAWLSQRARKLLDEAGFEEVLIMASNELDEHLIESLRYQGARIDVWCVGTKLVTGGGQSALGGVYKLAAICDEAGRWQPRLKLSEQSAKSSVPGRQQVTRYSRGNHFVGDAIHSLDQAPGEAPTVIDPVDPIRHKTLRGEAHTLLAPVFSGAKRLDPPETLTQIRARRAEQLARLHPGIRRLDNPHSYPAGLDRRLWQRRTKLLEAARPSSKSMGS